MLKSAFVSSIMEAFRNSGLPSVGLWCSTLMDPVIDSVPLTTEGEPLPTWMLSSQGPGT